MNPPPAPQPLSSVQQTRLSAFIQAQPPIDCQRFSAKWDLPRSQIAQICRVDTRTCNTWFSGGRSRQTPQPHHEWYLTLADLVLEQFENLPASVQTQLCPSPPET